jgi:nucleotide-binding universal stress UspA family protein
MKFLIPVDGSDQSNAALDFVASRSTLIGQDPEVHLLNVQPTLSVRVSRAIGREEAKAYQRAQADDVLRPAVARLKRAGIAAKASYVLGSRSDAIGAVAVRGGTDLIVMGSRGHSGLKGLLFGSMANAVLAGCTKPLLILRSAKTPQRDSLSVGIAVDGSRYGQAAVRWAIKHRDLFGAEPRIELMHVIDGERTAAPPIEGLAYHAMPVYGTAADDHALAPQFAKVMAGALKLLAKAGLKVTAARLLGAHAGDAIAAHARKRQLDVLVMGSHGQGAFKSLVLGSVAMRVAARSDKPLLLIRDPRHAGRN